MLQSIIIDALLRFRKEIKTQSIIINIYKWRWLKWQNGKLRFVSFKKNNFINPNYLLNDFMRAMRLHVIFERKSCQKIYKE